MSSLESVSFLCSNWNGSLWSTITVYSFLWKGFVSCSEKSSNRLWLDIQIFLEKIEWNQTPSEKKYRSTSLIFHLHLWSHYFSRGKDKKKAQPIPFRLLVPLKWISGNCTITEEKIEIQTIVVDNIKWKHTRRRKGALWYSDSLHKYSKPWKRIKMKNRNQMENHVFLVQIKFILSPPSPARFGCLLYSFSSYDLIVQLQMKMCINSTTYKLPLDHMSSSSRFCLPYSRTKHFLPYD